VKEPKLRGKISTPTCQPLLANALCMPRVARPASCLVASKEGVSGCLLANNGERTQKKGATKSFVHARSWCQQEVSLGFTVNSDGAPYLQLDDAFFDGVLDDEASGVNGLELSQAVRAVDGLHFSGGVPPPEPRTEIGRHWADARKAFSGVDRTTRRVHTREQKNKNAGNKLQAAAPKAPPPPPPPPPPPQTPLPAAAATTEI